MTLVQKLTNALTSWFTQNATHLSYLTIPKGNCDNAFDDAPLPAQASYFRLWLSQMFLVKQRDWFADALPAVSSTVKLKHGDLNDISLGSVARVSLEAMGKAVPLNYRLTDLLPFYGGVVEVESSLLALKGKEHLGAMIDVLKSFSDLIAAPISQVLNVASRVNDGVQQVFGAADGEVHLAFHQSFVSAGAGLGPELRPGYQVVIKAPAGSVRPEQLFVRADGLFYLPPGSKELKPYDLHDYMLFRIEGRRERDDWRLKNIEELMNKAITAWGNGDEPTYKTYRLATFATILQTNDLTPPDRRRVALAVKAELDSIAEAGLGLAAEAGRNMTQIMADFAMSTEDAIAAGPIHSNELLL